MMTSSPVTSGRSRPALAPPEITQGTTRRVFSDSFDFGLDGSDPAQQIDVTLVVSDDPSFNGSTCPSILREVNPPNEIADSLFSPFGFSLPYQIVCDTSAPTVNAGTDLVIELQSGQSTTDDLTFVGQATDVDSGISDREWGPSGGSCGGGIVVDDSQEDTTGTVVCRFSSSTTLVFQATNGCGDVVSDTLRVTVIPAN